MPELQNIPNEMILASAGSGKTYQLTNRYIALMAIQLKSGKGVHPERIIAVTFTRKAAGEFFDAILVKLAKAASDPDFAANLGGDGKDPLSIALSELTPEEYCELLRIFIQKMPRLFLGTLDSFFSNILRSFPAEFGLTADFEVMDDYRAANAIDRVYEVVFSRHLGSAEANDKRQAEFLEAFRLATFGREESNVIRSLDAFVQDLHNLYLSAPDSRYWGDPTVIWNRDNNRWLVEGIDPAKEFKRLYDAFEKDPDSVNFTYWDEFREEIKEHRPGAPFGKRIKYMIPRFLEAWRDLENGSASIKFNRTVQDFDALTSEAVRRVTQWLVGGEIRAKLQRTRGVWELLHLYESTYAKRVRRQGQLTFQDIQLLLSGYEYEENGPAPILTQTPDKPDRLQIDYRLDTRYDHWLLDEFQDTNFIQWKVISNLIDEIVQDTSGTRSLFQVGDIKQAIYAWRGGDTRLFTDIIEKYNAREERIVERDLSVSYRSVPDIIKPVNEVFRDRAALEALRLPDETIERWNGRWVDHAVAAGNKQKPGYTAFLNPYGADGGRATDEDSFDLIKAVLEEVQPTSRGLSCAILVRSNRTGNEIIEYLRAHSEIPVSSESEQHIASDNPVNLALLSLFQLAAHPGDTFAWEHLAMTPFAAVIERDDLTAGALARKTARDVFEKSFEEVTRQFVSELETGHGAAFDEFTRSRIEAFALAARLFDETGSRDIDDFLSYVSRHTARDASDANAVQVMTYHKSKGLTFDMVILPDLKSNSLTTVKLDIDARTTKTTEARKTEWVLDMPQKDIVASDPVLREYLAEKEAEASYEALCMYYVAMTRARFANYLIAPHQGPKSRSMNFVRLLEDTIGGDATEITFGDTSADLVYQSDTKQTHRRWFESITPEESPELTETPTSQERAPSPRLRPRRRTPSGSEKGTVAASQIFTRRGGEARQFGTLVHSLFEAIEWSGEDTISKLREHCGQLTGFDETILEAALEQVEASLNEPTTREALAHPGGDAEAWRETSFEILLKGDWLSGTFDRVVVERDENGQPARATITDFKTDRVNTPAEIAEAGVTYQPQLQLYREVLSKMICLPESAIRTQLLFTRAGKLLEV